jgi:undecaprenyl-diphosphatase
VSGAAILTGILTFFVSLMTIAILMRLLRTMSFLPFVIYRVLLGAGLLAAIYSGMPLGAVN